MQKQVKEMICPDTGEVRFFRTPYSFTRRQSVPKLFEKPSRTKQSFRDECDINKIMERFMKTGNIDLVNQAKGQFADLSLFPETYHESLNIVTQATQSFSLFPAEFRERFGNDVHIFLDALNTHGDALFRASGSTAQGNPILSPEQRQAAENSAFKADNNPDHGDPE